MKVVDESKYSLEQDLKYGSASILLVTLSSVYYFAYGYFFDGFSVLGDSADHIHWGFLSIAGVSLVFYSFMNTIQSYPVLFSYSTIAILFLFLHFTGLGHRGHLLFLTALPLFMVYYIYLISTTPLEKPLEYRKPYYSLEDIAQDGSLSGS